MGDKTKFADIHLSCWGKVIREADQNALSKDMHIYVLPYTKEAQ